MSKHRRYPIFRSALGEYFQQYVNDKRAVGYHYDSMAWDLSRFDRFLTERGLREKKLPERLVREWIIKRPNEHEITHRHRIKVAMLMGEYLVVQGVDAYVPDSRLSPRIISDFRARIFTHQEVESILVAADKMPPRPSSPLQHIVMPLIFRILYGCGMRSGEVVRLKMRDVDLDSGILTVIQGKFRKDRLVPMSRSLTARIHDFVKSHRAVAGADDYLFPSPCGGGYDNHRVYSIFRDLLWRAGIAHGGPGEGPRVHDLRHTFAVHRLEAWYEQGEDLGVLLPALSTYMGHVELSSTQWYLQMTADMYPKLLSRLESCFSDLLPKGGER